MLHALNGRKARLGAFRGAGTRVPIEDVVTSTIFGPLGFMSPEDRRTAVACLHEAFAIRQPSSTGDVQLRFWPRLPLAHDALRARYVEPDLVLTDADGAVLVIEIKWGAPLGKHELAAQWEALSPSERRRSSHLLLVHETEQYREAVEIDAALLERRGLSPWRPVVRSWRSLTALPLAAASQGRSEAVRLWATAVADLVRREHRFSMHGWDQIGLRAVEELDWRYVQPWFGVRSGVSELRGWWNDE
ncbi:hypothetical protein [Sphingomonas sp. CFBP 8760]|uniref:hypothetical protein n=1 Tax=Sphingomonas sp. CFBP 8760 TaxID=2775282 RepID=UPI001783EC83|nr:hypothetical protein [Sphingomonas sp. CFBP 8760]MBD8548291.1 hypothetical protein [Sphingomonas sp. CFBP 8760]